MNILSVYSPHVASRTEKPRAADTAPDRRVEGHDDDAADAQDAKVRRKSSRADFSALMALLANAGPKVRAELLAQVPTQGVSLIDKLLDGTVQPSDLSDELSSEAGANDATEAADALRYGILADTRANASPASSNEAAIASVLARIDERAKLLPAENSPAQQHARDVLSRIAATRGSSVEQLKALGDEEAADVRVALDALLARAGTPSGLALAGENTGVAADMAERAAIHSTAMAAAHARSAGDVTTPVTDTDALAPELKSRLDRVIDRMKNEYGHDVRVVETVRSQDRQDFLYAQGRSRSGDIVTWTRDSAHTQGNAVDVNIDGSWKNAEGFARLQRIAREEGLRTLGVRDPGHLELANADRAANSLGARFNETPPNARRAVPLVASPMQQQGIAQVAQVANAAGVARVAEPGNGRGGYAQLDATLTAGTTDGRLNAGASAGNAGGQHGAAGRGAGDEQHRSSNDERSNTSLRTDARSSVPSDASILGAPSVIAPSTGSTSAMAAHTAGASAGVNAADRVADLQDQRDRAPAGSMSRMTLKVDTPDGGQDRITVDVRGNSVGTRIETDATNADRLRLHTADLQDALGRHGLESESVKIGSTARSENADARLLVSERDASRLNAAQQSSGSDGAMNHGQRERAAFAREWDRQDPSRQTRDEQHDAQKRDAQQRDSQTKDDARPHADQRGRRETFNWSHT